MSRASRIVSAGVAAGALVLVSTVASTGLRHPEPAGASSGPVRVILDTDMEEDVDDAGTLAMLHALQEQGEAELLAVMIDTPGKWGAPAADAINTYFGYPNVPIGTLKPTTTGTLSPYNRQIAEGFPNDLRDGINAPDAVALYRSILASQPDDSVVIASVGLLTNLANLLNSPADTVSPLTGAQLVQAKVQRLVMMGGKYPSGTEWNFQQDPAAAATAVNTWPGPIVFSGFEVGNTVMTGSRLFTETPHNSPVREAYRLYVGEGNNRNSWDQTALLYAIRGAGTLFTELGATGSNSVSAATGSNSWIPSVDKDQYYLGKAAPDAVVADAIEDLMVWTPESQTPPGSFVKAINLGGPALSLAGNPWVSHTDALSNGLTISPTPNLATNSRTPEPATATPTTQMLQSEIWRTGDLQLSQTLANGVYHVYLWVMEDYRANHRVFDVHLEGTKVGTVRSGQVGDWGRYGPFPARVLDGALTLDLRRTTGDVLLQGLEIYDAFVTGINMNGSAVTIQGDTWQAYSTAISNGLTANAPNLATNTRTPTPSTDAATTSMLRSELWKASTLTLDQPLSPGNYDITLWVLEDHLASYREFDIRLESVIAGRVTTGAVGSWQSYGPHPVSVRDSHLDLDLVKVRGDTLIQGLRIEHQPLPLP